MIFEPSLCRRGLDLLLAIHPHLDVLYAYTPHGGDELTESPLAAPWLRIDLGQPSEGDVEAYAVWQFAIWKRTGAVYRMVNGAVEDDPFIEPSPITSYAAEVRRYARREARIDTLLEVADMADKGVEITGDALREMAVEVERATTPIEAEP
jgi:hypothetical protein